MKTNFNNNINNLNKNFIEPIISLDANWVTGITDAEGSFIIADSKGSNGANPKISLRFSLTQKSHSVGILFGLQNFFGCGQVIPSSNGCMRFVVQRQEDIINKIIPHFIKYPLQTSKALNFNSFKEAAEIVAKGQHLNPDGLNKILYLKSTMNKARPFEELFNHYSATLSIKLNPFWVRFGSVRF